MNRLDKIIADKLNASIEYPVDHSMWGAIDKELSQTHTAAPKNSNGFRSSLYGGIAASVILGVLFTQLPDVKPVEGTSEAPIKQDVVMELEEIKDNTFTHADLTEVFKPQKEHKIEFSSMKVVQTKKSGSTFQEPDGSGSKPIVEKSKDVTKQEASPSEEVTNVESSNKTTPTFDFNASGIQCVGGEIMFTSFTSNDSEISWIFDGVHVREGKTSTFTFKEDGMHEVIMLVELDNTSYSVGKEIEIYSKPKPQIVLSSGTNPNCFKQSVNLKAEPGSNSYTWSVSGKKLEGADASLNLPTGNFTVALNTINEHGCFSNSTQNIVVEEGLKVLIPNSFTPDNNGINDVWFPKGLENCAKFKVSIFRLTDRTLVYETSENRPWSGETAGSSQRPGRGDQFIYEVIASDECGFTKKYSDILTVL